MNILGISAFYHDSAACIVRDGSLIAAAQEERFSRIKHDPSFPVQAVEYCLLESGISIADVDYVAFYEKPDLKFERILSTYLHYFPKGLKSYLEAAQRWLGHKFAVEECIREMLNYNGEIVYSEHHMSHAFSAFYPSPFKESAVITIDGVGEWATTSIGYGSPDRVDILKEIRFPLWRISRLFLLSIWGLSLLIFGTQFVQKVNDLKDTELMSQL